MGELGKRFVSSVVLAAALLGVLWLGGWAYGALLVVAGAIALGEFVPLIRKGWTSPVARALWLAFGALYLGVAVYGLWNVREQGFATAMLLFFSVWATDVGAFAFGKLIGGPRIAPAISPSKTWAGYIGAIATVAVMLVLVFALMPVPGMTETPPLLALIFGAALIATVAQAGDFLESWLKRRAGVKDSGAIIPGHGGLLDRVDGLLALAALHGGVMLTGAGG